MDITPIEARLRQIRSSLYLLREIQSVKYEHFVLSAAAINIAEHQFQIAIQAAIDIGQQILADMGTAPPVDYADVFVKLGEVGVLPGDFAQQLVPMARFRNVLVHLYLEVDLGKVYTYLQDNVDDLESYANLVVQFVQQRASRKGGISWV